MRARLFVNAVHLVAVFAVLAACGHDEPSRVPTVRLSPPITVPGGDAAAGPSSYVVSDAGGRGEGGFRVKIGTAGQLGVVVDGARAIVGKGEPVVATEIVAESLTGAAVIPARLGGGFLFHTDRALYRAATFTGALQPLGRVTDTIQSFSFATKSVLVRARNGERWSLGLPSGDRVAADFAGVADIEALDDGRALAFDDQGLAYVSTDAGAHWSEVTSLLKSSPTRVAVVKGELWFLESGGGAQRLESDGRLVSFDTAPEEEETVTRAADARWRGGDTPLRTAFTLGAAIDDNTAVVCAEGDIVKVDVRTGDLVSVATGKLPPHSICQALSTSNDVLFACTSSMTPGGAQSGAVSAFVASRTLTGDPVVEQSFAGEGLFWGGDDGGLAFGAPCGVAPSAAPPSSPALSNPLAPAASHVDGHTQACVRQPDGSWRDVEVPPTAIPPGTSEHVARWIPRADGTAVALLSGQVAGVYDPHAGSFERLPAAQLDVTDPSAPSYRPRRYKSGRVSFAGHGVVDTSWTLAPNGALRGYLAHMGSVEIAPGGRVSRSPYVLDVVPAGAFALGRTAEGRLYQTSDHGASWVEVERPPTGAAAGGAPACTSAGCDLGAFYRIGWAPRSPRPEGTKGQARPAPDVRRVRSPELACRPSGPAQLKTVARTSFSPEDLGLGATKLPVTADNQESLLRTVLPRGIIHPVHDPSVDGSDAPGLRGVLSGYRTTNDGDALLALGPVRSIQALRRTVSFLGGFDPTGTTRRAAIGYADVLAAGRAAGMTTDEIMSDDMTESGNLVAITPRDGGAASEMVFHNARGLLAVLRPDRSRVVMRPSQNDGLVVSAAALGGDEVALLEIESGGPEHVFKVSASGASDLFDLGTNLGDAMFYPGNPDAIAIGPKGDIAIVRTASGSEPASELDPALLVVPGSKPKALAPWSKLVLATDPACAADTTGYRTTLQLIGPWIRTASPDLRVEEGPMLARVKWSESRVCLEGLEVKVPGVNVRVPGESGIEPFRQSSWLVSRGGSFARVAVGEGVDWRQPLECTLTAP